jgi:hypothetical protein
MKDQRAGDAPELITILLERLALSLQAQDLRLECGGPVRSLFQLLTQTPSLLASDRSRGQSVQRPGRHREGQVARAVKRDRTRSAPEQSLGVRLLLDVEMNGRTSGVSFSKAGADVACVRGWSLCDRGNAVAHAYSCNAAILRTKHSGGVNHGTRNNASGSTERWHPLEAVNGSMSRCEEMQIRAIQITQHERYQRCSTYSSRAPSNSTKRCELGGLRLYGSPAQTREDDSNAIAALTHWSILRRLAAFLHADLDSSSRRSSSSTLASAASSL